MRNSMNGTGNTASHILLYPWTRNWPLSLNDCSDRYNGYNGVLPPTPSLPLSHGSLPRTRKSWDASSMYTKYLVIGTFVVKYYRYTLMNHHVKKYVSNSRRRSLLMIIVLYMDIQHKQLFILAFLSSTLITNFWVRLYYEHGSVGIFYGQVIIMFITSTRLSPTNFVLGNTN